MSQSTEKIVVNVESRTEFGKNACRRVRAAGHVPGNVYGMGKQPFAVQASPRRIDEVLRLESGRNTIFTLSLDGGKASREVMVRELQRDPVSGGLLHVDFVRVDPNRKLHVRVPVRLIGTPIGVRLEGGIVDFVHREVEVECLPAAIPEHFDVDVTGLHINQNVAVKDLALAEGVDVLDDPESILAVVAEPRKEEEPETVAAEDEEGAEAEGEAAEAPAEGSTDGEGS